MTLSRPQGGFLSMGLLKDLGSQEDSVGSMLMMMSPGLLAGDSREPG